MEMDCNLKRYANFFKLYYCTLETSLKTNKLAIYFRWTIKRSRKDIVKCDFVLPLNPDLSLQIKTTHLLCLLSILLFLSKI